MIFRIYLNSNIASSQRKYKNIPSNEIKFSQLNIRKFNRDLSSNFKFQTKIKSRWTILSIEIKFYIGSKR